jgi:hypothetical protein
MSILFVVLMFVRTLGWLVYERRGEQRAGDHGRKEGFHRVRLAPLLGVFEPLQVGGHFESMSDTLVTPAISRDDCRPFVDIHTPVWSKSERRLPEHLFTT